MLKVSYTTFYQKKAIIDANVLIDLSEIGTLDLINRVFSVVGIPEDIIHFSSKNLIWETFTMVLLTSLP